MRCLIDCAAIELLMPRMCLLHVPSQQYRIKKTIMANIEADLGFPEERPTAWLTNRYFPSKVGGKPAWLELKALPQQQQLQCKNCKAMQTFLCQIYAPFEDEHNFHRTIFVFVCRAPQCQLLNKADNFTVLRSQLAKCNDFYAATPPLDDGEPLPAVPTKSKICFVCGSIGPLCCSACRSVSYCQKSHQVLHWQQHKSVCKSAAAQEVKDLSDCYMADVKSWLPEAELPEWEIVIESEPKEPTEENKPAKQNSEAELEGKRLAEYDQLLAAGKAGTLQTVPDEDFTEHETASRIVEDKTFSKFKAKIASEPDQIVRYALNGQPLWIADTQQTFKAGQLQVPACAACGSERQFEFQIMPQMLNLLKDKQLDWGVLAIYTCIKSCQTLGYANEYIVKQDILPQEML